MGCLLRGRAAPTHSRIHLSSRQKRHSTGLLQAARYGPHETKVLNKLIGKLADNDIIEQDNAPWGALVALAEKPHHDVVTWEDFQWRLYISC